LKIETPSRAIEIEKLIQRRNAPVWPSSQERCSKPAAVVANKILPAQTTHSVARDLDVADVPEKVAGCRCKRHVRADIRAGERGWSRRSSNDVFVVEAGVDETLGRHVVPTFDVRW
jgi:hypothetical protein